MKPNIQTTGAIQDSIGGGDGDTWEVMGELTIRGDKVEVVGNQEQQQTDEDSEMSTLLRSISISEEEDHMDKQRIASLKVDDFGLAEDIADCIDENHVSDSRRNW